jgi:hypothetical protein
MLISNKQIGLCDKMPPKQVKIKKPFSNFAKSHFLFYLLGGGNFFTKSSFLKSLKLSLFTQYNLFLRKKFLPFSRVFKNFFETRIKMIETPEKKQNACYKTIFYIFCQSKTT